MSTISISDIKKLATLSAIKMTDEECETMKDQLEAILGYVKQLDDIDTAGLEPTYQVTGLSNVMRDDEIIDYGITREQLLANAPAEQDGQIKVRRVLG